MGRENPYMTRDIARVKTFAFWLVQYARRQGQGLSLPIHLRTLLLRPDIDVWGPALKNKRDESTITQQERYAHACQVAVALRFLLTTDDMLLREEGQWLLADTCNPDVWLLIPIVGLRLNDPLVW